MQEADILSPCSAVRPRRKTYERSRFELEALSAQGGIPPFKYYDFPPMLRYNTAFRISAEDAHFRI